MSTASRTTDAVLAAIDAATGCQQCGGPLGKSPSWDFCSDFCLEGWHSARTVPLVGYREPYDLPQHYSHEPDLDDFIPGWGIETPAYWRFMDIVHRGTIQQILYGSASFEVTRTATAGLALALPQWLVHRARRRQIWRAAWHDEAWLSGVEGTRPHWRFTDNRVHAPGYVGPTVPADGPFEDPWDRLPPHLREGCPEFEHCPERRLSWSCLEGAAPEPRELPPPTLNPIGGHGPETGRRDRRQTARR